MAKMCTVSRLERLHAPRGGGVWAASIRHLMWKPSATSSRKYSRKGFCRNPRGIYPTKTLGEFCGASFGGFFGAFFLGRNRTIKSTQKSTAKFESEFGSFAVKIHNARIWPWIFGQKLSHHAMPEVPLGRKLLHVKIVSIFVMQSIASCYIKYHAATNDCHFNLGGIKQAKVKVMSFAICRLGDL